jgi:hypothetical protein
MEETCVVGETRQSHHFALFIRLFPGVLSVTAIYRELQSAVGEWVADFPVKAEGIGYTSDAPALSFADGIEFRGASFQSAGKHFIGFGTVRIIRIVPPPIGPGI